MKIRETGSGVWGIGVGKRYGDFEKNWRERNTQPQLSLNSWDLLVIPTNCCKM
jgi:hypothetical protein